MMVGVASIWATVITIMFLSKMKTSQDIIAALFFLLIFFLANLDNLFARYQSYKVFRVLKPALIAEAKWAAVCVAVAVGLELSPLAWSPGWIYPCCAFTIHFLLGRHCHPMLILGSGMWLETPEHIGGDEKTGVVLHRSAVVRRCIERPRAGLCVGCVPRSSDTRWTTLHAVVHRNGRR
eukprot:GEMP01096962.1.p1 GENE.GEMP01096962.1~~GEMP01096962.1.p1  ORF type:complete len:179 (+),score=31.84 GEMP01096962.1:146-682(+)